MAANKLTDWLQTKAAAIVGGTLLTTAYAIWTAFRSALTNQEVVALSLLVFACLTWLAERFWHPTTRLRVRQWLDDSGFDIGTRHDDKAQFMFVATDSLAIKTTVTQFKADGPINFIAYDVIPTPNQQAAYRALGKTAQDAFWRGVKLEFFRAGIQYTNLTAEEPGVTLSVRLPVNLETTEVEFLGAMLKVRSATRFVFELFQEIEGRMQPSIAPEPIGRTLPTAANGAAAIEAESATLVGRSSS